MVNIVKSQKSLDKPIEKAPFSLDTQHAELKALSSKFLGLNAVNGMITDLVVEEDISEAELNALKKKLLELSA